MERKKEFLGVKEMAFLAFTRILFSKTFLAFL